MTQTWQYQIRLTIRPELAASARRELDDDALADLNRILKAHNARLKCQYDAFADYVAEAEAEGVEQYPLYSWTKATIENPAKKEKYLKSFALHVSDQEVYSREETDPLAAELRSLVGGPVVSDMQVHDTNPANNPQPPSRS